MMQNVYPPAAFLLALMATPLLAQQQPHDFLKDIGGFSDRDLSKLDRGSVISTRLDTEDNELALMGAARIEGTIETFLEVYNDIETFEAKLGTARKLSSPPKMSDVQELELGKADVKALEKCQVGVCDFKMGEQAMQELQTQIDWSSADAHNEIEQFVRERVLEYANAYTEGGNASLAIYRNKTKPQYVAKEFKALLDESPYVLEYRPELHAYLEGYPKATLDGASDFIYWDIINFGPKPTLRLNHVTIYPTEKGPNGATIITSKQLYYSHYFDTGFELYTLVPDNQRPENGFYVVTLNRYRTDLGGGFTGSVMRLGAEVGTKDAMVKTIRAAQVAVQNRSR